MLCKSDITLEGYGKNIDLSEIFLYSFTYVRYLGRYLPAAKDWE